MSDSNVIGLRVRPWSLTGKNLVRTTNRDQADVWSIEKCTIETCMNEKSYLNWKSIYDFDTEDVAVKEMEAMQTQLFEFEHPKHSEPPQAGDLILLQVPGILSGSLGLIEGVYGEFAKEFDVHLDAETNWICETNKERRLVGTGGLQYKIKEDHLIDTKDIIYHEFKRGFPSTDENKINVLPVRLYVFKAGVQANVKHRKTA